MVSLEELDAAPVPHDANRRLALDQLTQLIQRLKPMDRQVILAWLEGRLENRPHNSGVERNGG